MDRCFLIWLATTWFLLIWWRCLTIFWTSLTITITSLIAFSLVLITTRLMVKLTQSIWYTVMRVLIPIIPTWLTTTISQLRLIQQVSKGSKTLRRKWLFCYPKVLSRSFPRKQVMWSLFANRIRATSANTSTELLSARTSPSCQGSSWLGSNNLLVSIWLEWLATPSTNNWCSTGTSRTLKKTTTQLVWAMATLMKFQNRNCWSNMRLASQNNVVSISLMEWGHCSPRVLGNPLWSMLCRLCSR